jgi:hypothetical protein
MSNLDLTTALALAANAPKSPDSLERLLRAIVGGQIAGSGLLAASLTLTGNLKPSNAVVAAAGSTAADAAALTADINVVTGADNAKGVALPAAVDGLAITVVNASATASLKVYPVNGGNDNINALAEDLPFTVGPGKTVVFFCTSGTQWYVANAGASTERLIIPVCGNAKVGATAGWVITGGTDKYSATLPASQTDATLVIPISGLKVGDMVTGWGVVGQVESAGNNVTLAGDLRKLTAAAADLTDASISTDNVGTLTADTILSQANLGATGLTEVMAADESLYLLLTGTTAASTDIDVMAVIADVVRAP